MKSGNSEGFPPFKIYSPVQRHQGIDSFVDFTLKLNRIVLFHTPGQFRLNLIAKIRRSHKPLIRTYNIFIIHLFDFCTNSFFAFQFDSRHKEVQQRAQGTVDGGKGVPLRRRAEAVIADKVSDAGEVFLFNETVVVLAVGSRADKLDALVTAPFEPVCNRQAGRR
jgi:hypothetical protein